LFDCSVFHQLRLETFLLDELLNFVVAHEAIELRAVGRVTRISELALHLEAVFVLGSVPTTVVCQTKIDLLWVEVIEPQRQQILLNFTDVGVWANMSADSVDGRVPGTVEVVTHEIEEVDRRLHGLRIHAAKVPSGY
jgi:hypothetical protein